jgi:2-amino-4-hydroxy-6-hydroxymethyldihydropteridine diphosphokinase
VNTTTAYIGLGSNLGDGLAILQSAWKRIGEDKRITQGQISSPYMTAPLDMESSNWFTNAVGALKTSYSALEFLKYLLAIEADFGRTRSPDTQGYQDRTLDLDILFFGDSVMSTETLTLPHPKLESRLFVLEPLAEIAPLLKSQNDGITMREKRQQLHAFIDSGKVEQQEITKGGWINHIPSTPNPRLEK